MTIQIQGTTILTSGTKVTGAEAKEAAAQMGITLADNAVDNTKEYSQDEINKIIMQYANTRDDISTAWSTEKTTGNKEEVIAQLKEQYKDQIEAAYNGDAYKSDNPQLKALQNIIEADVIKNLGAEFTRSDIIDIINEVLPNAKISNTDLDGQYSVPIGHDDDAKAIYTNFINELSTATVSTPEIRELEQKISKETDALNQNYRNIRNLAADIEASKQEIKKLMQEVEKECEEKKTEANEEAQALIKSEISAYAASNGEMTYAQFEANLTAKLQGINPSLASVASKLTRAENLYTSIKSMTKQIGRLNVNCDNLKALIGEDNAKLANLKAAEAEKQAAAAKRCDPIGFTLSDGSKVDFFLDKDNDGLLSNEQEFLGFKDGWAEMAALDTSGDGKVDANELKNAGLKTVVRDEAGNQTIKDVSEIFKNGDFIDLSTYQKNGNKIADTDNILAGTFNVNINGADIDTGYNTLDTTEWLDNNYQFSDKDKGIGRFANGSVSAQEADPNIKESDYDYLINTEIPNMLTKGWAKIGITRDEIAAIIQRANDAQAKLQANQIYTDKQKEKAKAAEEKAKAEKEKEPVQEKPTDAEIKEVKDSIDGLTVSLFTATPDKRKAALAELKEIMNNAKSKNIDKEDINQFLKDILHAHCVSLSLGSLYNENKDDLDAEFNDSLQWATDYAKEKDIEDFEFTEKPVL